MVVPTASSWSRRRKSVFAYLGGKNSSLLVALLGFSFLLAFKYWRISEVSHQDPKIKKPKVTKLETNIEGILCDRAVERLIELNIRLVALDFDLTIVDIHTGGDWDSTARALASHIRPQMRCLIQTALQRGLHAAVTSFSVQEALIQEVITITIPIASNITVRGGRNRSEPQGKKKQLAEAIEAVSRSSGEAGLSPLNTILIDDDKNNVRRAKKDGYYSLWLDPDNFDGFFNSVISIQKN